MREILKLIKTIIIVNTLRSDTEITKLWQNERHCVNILQLQA